MILLDDEIATSRGLCCHVDEVMTQDISGSLR
jgi:hypothetical protein